MNFYFDTARMRPIDVALRFTVGQKAVIVKNKFDQLDTEGMNFVKVPFTQSWNQQ